MNVLDLSLPELGEVLGSWGEPAYRARQVYAGLWRRAVGYGEMTDLPGGLRARLADELPAEVEVLAERLADGGATRKALLRLGGRHVVEAVLMGYPDRVTVCVSSQVGCAMACSFCATGQMGLQGNLTAGEIAAQVRWARGAARELPDTTPRRLSNVVFMGMGEPLANERHTFGAIGRIGDPAGLGIGARHVTVSTVGVVPGIRRLAAEHPQAGLAVSLHAADDELRDRLVPPNRLWPLRQVEAAVAFWRDRTRRRPSIEWAMIRGENDDDRQADLLAGVARRLRAHVNLIPMNPIPGSPAQPTTPERMAGFVGVLRSRGVNVTVRDTRGRDIDAACGQLKWEHDRRGFPQESRSTEERNPHQASSADEVA
ncbi:MAG: 23S rRNA (adenine(2503)-C(2))-methyltransferase RlmN [Actinobacteria bacterium]|nr:23S rRNA (adenine(2503)-C(2))-methyltransferase RlmN [Actinomycetota bacterium]